MEKEITNKDYNIKSIKGKLIWNSDWLKELNETEVRSEDLIRVLKEFSDSLIVINVEKLPEGKTTPRGQYPKFRNDNKCAYPKRQDCNYGKGYLRCPYMKCISMSNWNCVYQKET